MYTTPKTPYTLHVLCVLFVGLCTISCGDDNNNGDSANAYTPNQAFMTLNLVDGRTITLRENASGGFDGILRFISGGGCSQFPCNQEKSTGLAQGQRDNSPTPEVKTLSIALSVRFETETNNPLETKRIFTQKGPLGVFDRFEDPREELSSTRPSITGIDWTTGDDVSWELDHTSVSSTEFGSIENAFLESTDTFEGISEESWLVYGTFGPCTLQNSDGERVEVESGSFNVWVNLDNEW